MKRLILPILLLLVLSSIVLVSCNEQSVATTGEPETLEETVTEGEGEATTTTTKKPTTGTRPTYGTIPSTTTAAPTEKPTKPAFTTKVIATKAPATTGSSGGSSGGTSSGGATVTPEEDEYVEPDLNLDGAPIPADPDAEVTTKESGVVGGNESPMIRSGIVNFLIEFLG